MPKPNKFGESKGLQPYTELAVMKLGKNSLGLSTKQIGELRAQVFQDMAAQIKSAFEVLGGSRIWSNQQVAVFKALLNKVLPDITANYHLIQNEDEDPRRLSRDQLERIAASALAKVPNNVDVIEGTKAADDIADSQVMKLVSIPGNVEIKEASVKEIIRYARNSRPAQTIRRRRYHARRVRAAYAKAHFGAASASRSEVQDGAGASDGRGDDGQGRA